MARNKTRFRSKSRVDKENNQDPSVKGIDKNDACNRESGSAKDVDCGKESWIQINYLIMSNQLI